MNDNIKNILKLINENPDLVVIPMVWYEVVCDDSYNRWYGSLGTAEIKEYTLYEMYGDGEEIVFKDRVELIMEYLTDADEDLSDEDIENIIDGLEWKRAIFLNIDLPE